MKSNIFLVAVFLLIAAGIFMFTDTGKDTFSNFSFSFSDGVILPKSEWEETLVGTWDFDIAFNAPTRIHRFTGDVEYKSDKSFSRYINMKYYDYATPSRVKESEEYMRVIGGGRITGTWSISEDGNFWRENITTCEVSNSFNDESRYNSYTACRFYPVSDIVTFGEINLAGTRFKLKTFNADKIIIEGESFEDDGKRVFVFTRKN